MPPARLRALMARLAPLATTELVRWTLAAVRTDAVMAAQVAELLPGRLVFAAMRTYDDYRRMKQTRDFVAFSVDDDLVRRHRPADARFACVHQVAERDA